MEIKRKIITISIVLVVGIFFSTITTAGWGQGGYIWKHLRKPTPTPTPTPEPTPTPTPTPTPEPTPEPTPMPDPTPTPEPTPTPTPTPTPEPTPTYSTTIVSSDNFETNPLSVYWTREMGTFDYAGALSTNHYLSGTHSYRFELRKSDARKRSELAQEGDNAQLQEKIYTFSTYLPNGGDEDYLQDGPKSSEVIAQWHNKPDFALGETWTSPPLALLTTGSGNYELWRLWDDATVSTNSTMAAKGFREYKSLGSYIADKGKWVNWKFHVKWGWLATQSPILEVYKNGALIYSANGKPNTTNDVNAVYMKFGIYKWEWIEHPETSVIDRRVLYYDDVTITRINR